MVQVIKLEVMVINHGGLDLDEVADIIESTVYPNRCISPTVMEYDTREVEWDDENDLNHVATQDQAFKEIFERR